MSRLHRIALVALVVASLVACSSVPSNTAPPPVTGQTEQLVVLGGDSAYGTDLSRDLRLRGSWAQLVLAGLPPGSSMIDLAAPGATTADVAHQQIPLAADLHPTIAVVALDGDGAGTDSSSDDVAQIVDDLRAAGATKVLVTDPSPPSAGSAVRSTVTTHGAIVVDTSTITSTGASGHQQVADAIKAAAGIA